MMTDSEIVAKLEELLAAIKGYDDPRRASAEWRQAFNHLKKTKLPANHVANVVAMRGVDRLAELITELRELTAPAPVVATAPGEVPDEITCKKALRAFKKRLKLTRLDDESQIDARNPLSKGVDSGVASIMPPSDWGPEVWQELERQGKLRHTGKGFYESTGQ